MSKLNQEEILKRANIVADAIDGLEIMDAIDVFGHAQNISVRKGNQIHCLLLVYCIAKMVNAVHGEQGIVKIKKDGSVSFVIKAGKDKKLEV